MESKILNATIKKRKQIRPFSVILFTFLLLKNASINFFILDL